MAGEVLGYNTGERTPMSKWKGSESWDRGQDVEREFESLLRDRDPNLRRANRIEQFCHIDYVSYFGTIDVKAKKRVNRTDQSEQDELLWVEFLNVQGKVGWLCGETDVIAFERDDDFVLVWRAKLLDLCKVKCDFKNRVSNSRDALYKLYQRSGRKDLISIIKMSDVFSLSHRIWNKRTKDV